MTATSARGLFRATGKKGKPVAVRDLDGRADARQGLLFDEAAV